VDVRNPYGAVVVDGREVPFFMEGTKDEAALIIGNKTVRLVGKE
jgi:hypothetical protein